MAEQRKELFNWLWKKEEEKEEEKEEIKFTIDEVSDLVDRICEFNCGAIDLYLTRHAKHVLSEWVEEKQQ